MPFVLCLTEASREVQGSGDVVLLSKERGEREREMQGGVGGSQQRDAWAGLHLGLLFCTA